MNLEERIDALSKQCYSFDHLNFDYRKFSLLIIEECAKLADDTTSFPFTSYGEKIRQHFGISE